MPLAALMALPVLAAGGPECSENMSIRKVPFALMGTGGVGAALLDAIVQSRMLHEQRYGVRLEAVALCDSSGVVKAAKGGVLSDETITAIVQHKKGGGRLKDTPVGEAIAQPEGQGTADFLLEIAKQCGEEQPGCIVVDCTATEATVPALLHATSEGRGMRAVTANKKPVSGPLGDFTQLVLSPGASARFRYEATVGAGLPVIAALQRVVAADDSVSRISGSFSGTLGYVMSGLQEGQPFSEVVAKAKELGYTEPDPRDDLGGVDVARKALILARTLGMKLEMSDVTVEPLFPSELAALSVPDFMAKLPTLDSSFADKVAAASAESKVLRYAASIKPPTPNSPGSLTVGLLAVPASSPLGTLTGSDNLVEIYTGWYSSTPLVLRGAGAGTGTTAAGVLSDIIELAFTM
ncbi:hypothetical protein AB1Y20_001406 [Prymnesium parvum]|uniref:Homoserine dehydrogenase n=1 Tax=Prymnesium parvum TaxID=97485 RepID=A0AB34K856_PRYPA